MAISTLNAFKVLLGKEDTALMADLSRFSSFLLRAICLDTISCEQSLEVGAHMVGCVKKYEETTFVVRKEEKLSVNYMMKWLK